MQSRDRTADSDPAGGLMHNVSSGAYPLRSPGVVQSTKTPQTWKYKRKKTIIICKIPDPGLGAGRKKAFTTLELRN